MGPFSDEVPLKIVVESRNGYSNALVTDKHRSLIPLDTVFTQLQAHREGVGLSDTPLSPFFREISPSSPFPRPSLHDSKLVWLM